MKITCLCMYHGRNWCLPESVESWRRQDYDGDAELLIVNDFPGQVIRCDLPGVRVENVPEIVNLSDKYNISVRMCAGDWVCLWDDDDISLPWRLKVLTEMARNNPDVLAYCTSLAWYSEDNNILNIAANLFCGSAFFQRDYYLRSGGAKHDEAPDRSAWNSMAALGQARVADHPLERINYIYRWRGVGVHDSQFKWKSAASRHSAFQNGVMADKRFVRDGITVVPKWDRDYVRDAKEALSMGVKVL